MNYEERAFKMVKLERYKENLVSAKKEELFYTFILSCICLGLVTEILDEASIYKFATLLSAFAFPFGLSNMVKSICTKANLESKIKDLEMDLDIGQMENGGKRL